jgi:hypothetical protein
MKLSCNMGRFDRGVRFVLATTFIGIVLFTDHFSDARVLAALGLAFAGLNVFAVVTGHCLMYRFTGTDTRPGLTSG